MSLQLGKLVSLGTKLKLTKSSRSFRHTLPLITKIRDAYCWKQATYLRKGSTGRLTTVAYIPMVNLVASSSSSVKLSQAHLLRIPFLPPTSTASKATADYRLRRFLPENPTSKDRISKGTNSVQGCITMSSLPIPQGSFHIYLLYISC